MTTDIIFEELGVKEKTILLRAFDYDVDDKGFVLTPSGRKIRSEEFPKEFISVKDAALTPGSLNVIEGTPTSISKFIREGMRKPHGPCD